jgi:DnaK suppressor protein
MNDACFPAHLLPQFRQRLARREAELADALRQASAITADCDDVTDFKVLAQEAALAAVDDAQAAQAMEQLRQVQAARRRMESGRFGICVDCGDPIEPRRLETLPATPWCASCRQLHEHEEQAARRTR